MTEPGKPEGAQPEPKTSAWQPLLVLPALGSLGLGVMLPLWLLAVTTSTLLSVAWCTQRLEQIGIRSQELLAMASVVSAVLVLGGLGATAWVSLQEALRKPGEARRGGITGLLLRHPWWTLGLGLVIANVLFLSEPSSHRLLAASVLLAQCSWFILTATWLAWRFAWGSLRLGWRMSRASGFMAGLVVAAGLFTAAGWSLFFQAAEELARSASTSLSNEARAWPRAPSASLGSSFSTSTTLPVVPALFEHPRRGEAELLLTPFRFVEPQDPDFFGGEDSGLGALAESAPDGFSECVLGLSAQLRIEATQLAGRYVDPTEAQDVVQDILLRICLRGRPPVSFPSYFIRSVQNRAREWSRRAARTCALIELPEPGCALPAEEDYLREEQSRAVSKALCSLTEDEQEVLRLRYFEGEGYANIAQRNGWTEENARKRVSRARQKFQAAYLEKCLR